MKHFFLHCIIIFSLFFFSPKVLEAAEIVVQSQLSSVDQGQQFYVDVVIDPEDVAINGIEGSIIFAADKLNLIRFEDASSIIGPWIERPKIEPGKISFSGIIPNGFSGVIDPFNVAVRKPGKIIRLVFEGRAAGTATITTTSFITTKNDGQGTVENEPNKTISIAVSDTVTPSVYSILDTDKPILSAAVVNDPHLFNGKATLIFEAIDKGSGVNRVEVQEGNRLFQIATSPYVLVDQSRLSVVTVRAIDNAGNISTTTIDKIYAPIAFGYILMSFIVLIILLFILYAIRRKKQKKLQA